MAAKECQQLFIFIIDLYLFELSFWLIYVFHCVEADFDRFRYNNSHQSHQNNWMSMHYQSTK